MALRSTTPCGHASRGDRGRQASVSGGRKRRGEREERVSGTGRNIGAPRGNARLAEAGKGGRKTRGEDGEEASARLFRKLTPKHRVFE